MKHNIQTTTPQTMTCAELDTYTKAHLGLRTTLTEPETVNTNPPFPLTQDTHLPTQITTPDGIYLDTKQKLQAKGINVTGTGAKEYVRILDQAVLDALATTSFAKDDYSAEDLAAITTNPFNNNADIVDLECLKYMTSFGTGLQIQSCAKLENIALPNNWTIFGTNGTWTNFWYDYNLKRIDFSNVTELANLMFQHSTKVEEVVIKKLRWVGNKYASTFTFPSSIKRIIISSVEQFLSIQYPHSANSNPANGGKASLYLTTDESTPLGTPTNPLTIPKTITQINSYALYNLQSVTNLHYAGTSEEWANVTLGTSPFYNLGTSVIHCDGDNVDVAISTT